MENRVTYDHRGRLDEVVTDGGAHLEHMGGKRWFLSMQRKDGTEFALWFTGKIDMTEERGAPARPMTGLLARLSEEQIRMALEYDGPIDMGPPDGPRRP